MKKNDLIIILFVAAISIAFFAFDRFSIAKNYNEKYVEIYSDNQLYKKVLLNKDDKAQIIEVENKYGNNTLKVVFGGVEMISADCRDKTCVNTGFIDKVGQSIICLPHKVVVKITADDEGNVDKAVDGVTY